MLITTNVRAFICREPVDMRKSIDGLSYLVEPMLKQNPASGNLFVFVARDRSKVKCLYWDRTSFALWYTRLEHGRFPSTTVLAELNAWLEGIEIPAYKPHHTVCVARVS
jgi:transposase